MKYKTLEQVYYSNRDKHHVEYETRFNSYASVHLPFTIHNNPAFFVLCEEVLSLLATVLRNDKDVMRFCAVLPGVALSQYTKKCLIDEIVLTNKIEGVNSSRKEIRDILATLEQKSTIKGRKQRFSGIVHKYNMLSQANEIFINTPEDIRSLYDEIVLDEVIHDNAANAPDGELFRAGSVVVNNGRDIIHSGIVPESEIIKAISSALTWMNDTRVEILFRICIFHYMFGYIHPFYDGNGRLARFILSYSISQTLEFVLAYRISGTIKSHIKQYYKAFETCNNEKNMGDLTPFLIMMLNMIKNAQNELIAALKRRIDSLDHYEEIKARYYKQFDQNLLGFLIQASLFSEYGISHKDLLLNCEISAGTLKARMDKLRGIDLLQEKRVGKEKYYKIDLKQFDEVAQE